MSDYPGSRIVLQTEIYPLKFVQKALLDYGEYLSAVVSANDAEAILEVTVRPAFASRNREVLGEFLNYLLDLSLGSRLQESDGEHH